MVRNLKLNCGTGELVRRQLGPECIRKHSMMQQQREQTDDDERKGERKKRRKRGKGGGQGRETHGARARGSGKDDSQNSTTLPLGGCSSARPELEFSKQVLQMSVWEGSGA